MSNPVRSFVILPVLYSEINQTKQNMSVCNQQNIGLVTRSSNVVKHNHKNPLHMCSWTTVLKKTETVAEVNNHANTEQG